MLRALGPPATGRMPARTGWGRPARLPVGLSARRPRRPLMTRSRVLSSLAFAAGPVGRGRLGHFHQRSCPEE